MSQFIGTLSGILIALVGGFIIYGIVHKLFNVRLTLEQEYDGADLSIHKINATPRD